jgi:hypothetical protein
VKTTEAELKARYPHVVEGSLQQDQAANKQTVLADLKCGCRVRLFTSDLFQVQECPTCRKARKERRLAELKAEWAQAHEEAVARKEAKKAAKKAEREARKQAA